VSEDIDKVSSDHDEEKDLARKKREEELLYGPPTNREYFTFMFGYIMILLAAGIFVALFIYFTAG